MSFKIVLVVILAFTCSTVGASEYQVSKKIPLPGEGGWDYLTVDESARRLYVSHATQVVVLNIDTLEIVGSIPGLSGVHGIARRRNLDAGSLPQASRERLRCSILRHFRK